MTRVVLDAPLAAFSEAAVKGDEFRYVTRVRRHREGDAVEVRDRDGRAFRATVSRIERDRLVLSIGDAIAGPSRVAPVTLLVAVPKRHLMDDVVRKLSELGVARLVPVLCDRATVHPGVEKVERWRRIARESLRQCGRGGPLVIDEPTSFEAAVQMTAREGSALILHPHATERVFPLDAESNHIAPPLAIAIGPEGGFTDAEVKRATEAGFAPVKLSTPILRIETAALACAVLAVSILS